MPSSEVWNEVLYTLDDDDELIWHDNEDALTHDGVVIHIEQNSKVLRVTFDESFKCAEPLTQLRVWAIACNCDLDYVTVFESLMA